MAQESVKRILQLLDVEPKDVLLAMRLMQKGELVMSPHVSTMDHSKASVWIEDKENTRSVTVTPHLCRDGKTVRLVVQVNKEKPIVQNLKLGVETKFVFPGNQELFVTIAQPPRPTR